MALKTCLVLSLILFGVVNNMATQIKLENNGYEGLVIAINPSIPENPLLIQKLKVRSLSKYF